MITLKDIKISKNRIPVQNAIWLRPIGGLKFKLYYPHGGDWTEMKFDGSSPEPSPSPIPEDIEQELKQIEDSLITLSKRVERYNEIQSSNFETAMRNISKLQSETNKLDISIARLYSSAKISTLLLTRDFPISNRDVEVLDPAYYGIDDIYLKAMANKTAEEAYFEEEGPYGIEYEQNWWRRGPGTPQISRFIVNMMRVAGDYVVTARWIMTTTSDVHRSVTNYSANKMQYQITENTVFIPNLSIDKLHGAGYVTPMDIICGEKEMLEWGITLETLQKLGSGEECQVFVGKTALPYTAVGSVETSEDTSYYTINMECNDLSFNAKKVIILSCEVIDSNFGECEFEYMEEAVILPDEEE